MKKLVHLFLAIIALNLVSCDSDDDNNQPVLNLIQTLSADTNYSILVSALDQTDLTTTLSGSEQYTIFAPNNDAFQELLDSNPSWNDLTDIPNDLLTQVLLNHVVSGTGLSSTITTGYVSNLAYYDDNIDQYLSMYINTDNGIIINGGDTNGGATVSQADLRASNGVIHQVDAVIALPTVVTFATADSNFTTLATALTSATPNTDFASILSGNGPYTVFAPTNDAFQELLDPNPSWNNLDDIGETTLTDVLNYHVADGNIRAEELTNNMNITTLLASVAPLTIIVPGNAGSVATIDDGSSIDKNIVVNNVQAANGVIHVPEAVLLPN